MERVNVPTNGLILSNADNFKIAQALYYVVTGKTEKTTKPYRSNYHIIFEDLEQLFSKLKQMITQWDVLGDSCNVIVNHNNGEVDEFSSFERFKLYDSSKASSIEDIVFSFSFLIRQKGLGSDCKDTMQNYSLTVRILNKVSFYNSRRSSFSPRFMRMLSDDNLVLEIEYVDYAIARNIISTIDSWEAELEKNDTNNVLEKIQSVTGYIPVVTRVTLFCFTCKVLFSKIDLTSSDVSDISKYGIFSAVCIYLSIQIGFYIGKFIERNIDGLSSIAYIDINRGDKKELRKYHNSNFRKIGAILGMILGACLVTIFTEKLVDLIKTVF